MPNLWNPDGSVAMDQSEGEYAAQQQWDWEPRWRGYRATFPTAADDFAAPHTPTIEEELEELI